MELASVGLSIVYCLWLRCYEKCDLELLASGVQIAASSAYSVEFWFSKRASQGTLITVISPDLVDVTSTAVNESRNGL